ERGVFFSLNVTCVDDLCRKIVKSKYGVIRIPKLELELEQPRGYLTAVEGILQETHDNITERMREALPQMAENEDVRTQVTQIQGFLMKLQELIDIETSFVVELDDPSGNSLSL
ncbi:hypothetical protein KIPB_014241, partial [Kipferlia bialata]